MSGSLRRLAFEVLRSGADHPLREVDKAAAQTGLDPRDRGLLRRIVATEIRRRGTLRALVRQFCPRKPSPELCTHLHVGLAQILFLDRVPDHAAVSETVDATTRTLGTAKGRFMNGVLRNVLRMRREGSSDDPRCDLIGTDWHFGAQIFHDPEVHPHLWAEDAFSMPAALMKRWSKRYGEEEALRLARVGLEEVPLSLRVDGPSRDAFLAELEAVDAHPRAGRDASIVLLPSSETELALATKTFKSGQVSVQGEAALTAARRVEAKEGDRVLELCAAPGGKTVILARAGAKVLACDIHSGRLERVTENLERTGLQENVELRVSDGALGVPETDFDAVLIDAPCSNTGVLAQRPSARWRFGPKSQAALRELQERLLFEGADKVRSGGRLIYSTCSLEPDENAQIVKKLIDQRPEFAMVRETKSMPHPETLQGPIDGGYVAQLSRS